MKHPAGKPEDRKEGREKPRKVWTTSEIFCGEREVIIRHSDTQYRLQITRAGKLILNK